MIRPLTTLLFLAALATTDASATTASGGISRCQSADGETIYTDTACADLGARTATMSAALVRTLADAGSEASTDSTPLEALLSRDNGRATGRAPVVGCPRTPDQLQVAFQHSIAAGDVNELAAIYDWTDVSGRQSRELLKRLERISRSRVQDVGFASNGIRRRAGCLLLAL